MRLKMAGGDGSPGEDHGGPHHPGDRPPPLYREERPRDPGESRDDTGGLSPLPGDEGRAGGGEGQTQAATGAGRGLQEAGQQTAGGGCS